MNERFTKIKSDSTTFWQSRTKNQKGAMIGGAVAIIALAAAITYFSTRTTMVQLFPEMSQAEVGSITEVLTSQGVKYEVTNGGTTILVPENQVQDLQVSLASQGYPDSGEIDTSFFTSNAGFGMTDNEFNVIKKAAIETDLTNLLRKFDGVKDAKTIITLPDEGVFLKDAQGESTAAIVLTTSPGHKFTDDQIKGLFNLVAMSIPNLSKENIQISNQYGDYYDLESAENGGNGINTVEGQMDVKKTIERDLQRQVQQMLGTLIGQDKVVVNVSADIDFKKENREENLVQPVDEENMSGIEISAQRITETYSGGTAAAGSPEAENATDNFVDYIEGTTGDGDYERVEETINNDVNRIRREIQESPYKIRNLGIQVMVEPPGTAEEFDPSIRTDIEQILSTIVRTSIDQDAAGDLTDEEIANRIVVSVQQFQGNDAENAEPESIIPWWVWVIGGILLVAIALLVLYVLRARKRKQEEEELDILEQQQQLIDVEDISEEKETEATVRRKQLEKMAKEKPEDFAKLLRSWIADE
ncbi:flagellar basal-body MS-ring/collar protein FliF [Solibacillus daqui]|uniref:flagellar basal-body MS-ring/collar protein FliF n=1 Tax=Solibacillus daqui TaxID=2912187 RepID=UPI00236661D0|nr:flagellar basal-body MS-ring/collar protein FliF [Solibacillus daqui]